MLCHPPLSSPTLPYTSCHQTCVEMINRNAYVYIALKGYGYCEAVGKVFQLLTQYTALLMFVNVLSEWRRVGGTPL